MVEASAASISAHEGTHSSASPTGGVLTHSSFGSEKAGFGETVVARGTRPPYVLELLARVCIYPA
jgi:hypothetical protein